MIATPMYNLASCPRLPAMESWNQARKRSFNPGRLLKADVCFRYEPRILQIKIPTRGTERFEEQMDRLFHYDWRYWNSPVFGTEIHLELLTEEYDAGVVMRLIKRAYLSRDSKDCLDVGEITFLVQAGQIRIYRDYPYDNRELVNPADLGIDHIMTTAQGLAECCMAAFRIEVLCSTCKIYLSGIRLPDRVYRLGEAHLREEGSADN